ncbi:peptidase M50 [Thermodesulfatator indicus DSM 15286]|uniref:Peptidase M50 n=1 Tax=Thermodesulfatator indicus (strain DSM 15286 / JCM 11887 / CIR29812) TaxID=667014 RepID=F8AD22_THEID|nr:site-2 protease family protein [Thermodesulfatator indicus]AEH45891.1 peptidase M50 [Thermodesulfatator indicus DSM 15286]
MDFLPDFRILIIMAVPLLAAVTVHEVAHGWIAYKLGDPTAKMAGRLTLNPVKHLDLFGTLAFIITQAIGWARPVPVDPRNFSDPRRDMMLVALAGPCANFLLAVLFAILLRFFDVIIWPLSLLGKEAVVFFGKPLLLMLGLGIQLNIGLGVFNLLPVPPLDGSKILMGLLPRELAYKYSRLEPYGFFILLLLIFTGVIQKVLLPVVWTLSHLLRGGII